MPLEQRVIQPIYASQGIVDGEKNIYNLHLPNELECFTNETLANVIKQLASLSQLAEDLFGSIMDEVNQLINRTGTLQQRVDGLSLKVTQLDSMSEDVSLHDIHVRKPYKPPNTTVQEIFSKKTLPNSVLQFYLHCDRPPHLQLLNPYRDDGKDSLKFYTNPNFFFELWREAMLRQVEKEKTHKKISQRPEKKPRPPANSNERYRKMVSQQEFLSEDMIANQLKSNVSLGLYGTAPNRNPEVQFYDQYDTVRRRPINSNPHLLTENGHYGYTVGNGYPINDKDPQMTNGNYTVANANGHQHLMMTNEGTYALTIATSHNYPQNKNGSNGHYYGTTNGNYVNQNHAIDAHQHYHNQTQTVQTLSRRSSSAIRPSQPPPAPPLLMNTTNGHSNSYPHLQQSKSNNQQQLQNQLYNHHFQQTNQAQLASNHVSKLRDSSSITGNTSLPPPPPPPLLSSETNSHSLSVQTSSDFANNAVESKGTRHQHPVNGIANTNTEKKSVPIPPPPPLPKAMLASTLKRQTSQQNGMPSKPGKTDTVDSTPSNGVGQSTLAQEILQKHKQLQPISQKPRPVPKSDPRNDLLAAIREGIKLRRVEDSKQKEVEKSALVDVASILARRVAMELSESESEDLSDISDCWDDEAEN